MDDTTNVPCKVLDCKRSIVSIDPYLLLILTEITDHTPTAVANFFVDRMIETSNCPSNVWRRCWDKKNSKNTRVLASDGIDSMKIIVMRGYYPNTPIAFKMSVFIDSTGADLVAHSYIEMILNKRKHKITENCSTIIDNNAIETLIQDVRWNPELSRPRAMTPTGAGPQHFRSRRRSKSR